MIPKFTEDVVQFLCDDWWIEDSSTHITRGSLIRTFLPHIDQITNQFFLKGRASATDHFNANFEIKSFDIRERRDKSSLPVAGMPLFESEIYTIHRSKSRYALVLSCGGDLVDRQLRKNFPNWQTAHKVLVAPYYSIVNSEKRSGFNPKFIDRVMKAGYSQYFWDILPTSYNAHESILKLNHIQPAGNHYQTCELTNYRLSDDALDIMDLWFNWLISGTISEETILYDFKIGFE